MAKISKEEEWRRSGMAYALKIAREKGIDGLEEEIKFRNITKCPMGLSTETAMQFLDENKKNCTATFNLLSLLTLHDEFGFGKSRLIRFYQRFMEKTECLIGRYTDWREVQQILIEECDILVELPEEMANFIEKEN